MPPGSRITLTMITVAGPGQEQERDTQTLVVTAGVVAGLAAALAYFVLQLRSAWR